MGKEAGCTDEMIDGLQRGEASDDFDQRDPDAVDELQEKSVMSDGSVGRSRERLDERQRMDLVFTIGCYGALLPWLSTHSA